MRVCQEGDRRDRTDDAEQFGGDDGRFGRGLSADCPGHRATALYGVGVFACDRIVRSYIRWGRARLRANRAGDRSGSRHRERFGTGGE